MGYKKHMKTRSTDENAPDAFTKAVKNTPEISLGLRSGLQALKNNASRVEATDTRKLNGSVDIDETTKNLYPEASRWDYVIGYEGKAYFLEVHSANTSDIDDMLKKADWLRQWLNTKAPALEAISGSNCFYWVSTNDFQIVSPSPQARKLAQSKVKLIGRVFKLPPKL